MTHVFECSQRSEVMDPLELELQAVVNHQTWILGTKLRSLAVSLAPQFLKKILFILENSVQVYNKI